MTTKKQPCPRCLGAIPNAEHEGEYPGALSRLDNATEICSACGMAEAMNDYFGITESMSEWPMDFSDLRQNS